MTVITLSIVLIAAILFFVYVVDTDDEQYTTSDGNLLGVSSQQSLQCTAKLTWLMFCMRVLGAE